MGVALMVLEMVTPGIFVAFCFGLGAVAASAAAYFGASVLVCWAVFLITSVVFVLIARPLAKRLMKGESRASNVDELIGMEGMVTQAIAPHAPGSVKVRGEHWRAESAEAINTNALVEILKVSGTYLIVKKKETQ